MSKPMFAKRHYEAVAEAIQQSRFHALTKDDPQTFNAQDALTAVVAELAGTFARDNGQFKRDRFIAACVPGANVRARS